MWSFLKACLKNRNLTFLPHPHAILIVSVGRFLEEEDEDDGEDDSIPVNFQTGS